MRQTSDAVMPNVSIIGSTVEFTKAERRQLREFAGSVYEVEAHQMLEELESEFKRWREGEILSSELLGAIHEFHQHESRELWSMYQALREPEIVASRLGARPPG